MQNNNNAATAERKEKIIAGLTNELWFVLTTYRNGFTNGIGLGISSVAFALNVLMMVFTHKINYLIMAAIMGALVINGCCMYRKHRKKITEFYELLMNSVAQMNNDERMDKSNG